MAATFRVRVLTPERTVFEGEIVHLEAPGSEGFLGVLAHHAPLLTALRSGALTLREESGRTQVFALSGGILEVSDNQATILADAAERPEEIDVSRAESARERAERRLAQRTPDIDVARAEGALARAMNRIRVAREFGGAA